MGGEWLAAPTAIADEALASEIQRRLDDLTKPPGSLGRLEQLVRQYCLCRGSADADLRRAAVYTFAGDHGITGEGVTPYPSEVTAQMVMNMAAGGAAVSVMCRKAGIEYTVVDVGVQSDLPETPGLLRRKVAYGTASFVAGPAMSERECEAALRVGYELAGEGHGDVYGIGDMGIGNTSSSSALYALLLDMDAAQTVGMGTGSAGDILERKRSMVAKGVARHRAEWNGSASDALRRVGGLELAALTGFILGAANARIPVVVDGFIVSAAALAALRMCETVRDYLIFAHTSAEAFHRRFLEQEGIHPLLDLGMRLGEGTGAVLGIQILMQAISCYRSMATFSGAGVANRGE